MRVWVTRAEPEARHTAQRLTAAGHKPLVAPLIKAHPLPAIEALAKALDGVGALAFTSVNGVRAFAALRPISDRDLPAFTVGEATARAAHEAGFVAVISGEGDVAALAGLISGYAGRLAGGVLHPAALEPAGDLVADLQRRGLAARAVAVYETRPVAPSAEVLAALDQDPPALDAVLIHSAKAARVLAKALKERPATSALTAVCISKAAAEPLAGLPLARLLIADSATEVAMLARLCG